MPLLAAERATAKLLDLSLEQLLEVEVIATPRFAATAQDIPSSVTVLSQTDIQRFGWRSLADALRSLAGYTVTNDYSYSYATSRGLAVTGDYRSRTQILLDGVRINENIYDSVSIDSAFPLDLSMVERIEIIRGPSASVFGGNSLFGVINVISRKGNAIDGARLSTSVASGNARKASIAAGKVLMGMDLAANFSAFSTQGRSGSFPELAAINAPAQADDLDAETGHNFFARLTGPALRLSVYASDRIKRIPTGSYGTILNDSNHTERDTTVFSDLGYNYRLNDSMTWDNRVYTGYYHYDGRFPYDYDPDYVINQDKVHGKWWGVESSVAVQFSTEHRLITGLEYRDNFTQQQINQDLGYGCYELELSGPCLSSNYSSTIRSAFLQDELQLGSALKLTLGLRYDKITEQNAEFNPRLGLVYKTRSAGNFKYLFAEAFRYANPSERLYVLPFSASGNQSLDPENLRSHELTWEYPVSRQLQFVASYYHYVMKDFIDADADGYFINIPSFKSRGLELSLAGHLSPELDLRLSYSHQHTFGNHLEFKQILPSNSVKLNLGLQLPVPGLHGGLEWQLYAHRETLIPGAMIGGYGLLNLTIDYQRPDSPWAFASGIKDALDRAPADPVARDDYMDPVRDRIIQLGRSWFAELSYQF